MRNAINIFISVKELAFGLSVTVPMKREIEAAASRNLRTIPLPTTNPEEH